MDSLGITQRRGMTAEDFARLGRTSDFEFFQGLQDLGVQDPKKVQVAVNAKGIIQVCCTTSAAYVPLAAQIPYDNSKPQLVEGTEILAVTIAPTDAANKLLIHGLMQVSSDTIGVLVADICQDVTPDSIVASAIKISAVDDIVPFFISHYMTAGTTQTIKFRLLLGPSMAATAYLNGNSAGGKFDGLLISSLMVWEIKA